jgi:hypothetical protein
MSFESTWVEHVLSQKPAAGRKWRADFSDEQRKEFDARGAHLRRYCYSIAIDPLARGLHVEWHRHAWVLTRRMRQGDQDREFTELDQVLLKPRA